MSDRGETEQDPFRRWQQSSRAFLDSASMSETLRERCTALFAAWSRFARTYAEASGAAGPAAGGGPFDPVGWMDAGGAAGFGDLWRWFGAGDGAGPWSAEGATLRGSAEWARYALALDCYRGVMAAAWFAAYQRFADELGKRKEAPDWERIRQLWQLAADAELDRAQRSDAFLGAQREVIRARLALAALLRERTEQVASLLGLPTRSEVDELQETVHALRREIRALRARLDPAP
jgi:poly[(R)-3-hydroxyalkanoate] polymerase subunit PhaE